MYYSNQMKIKVPKRWNKKYWWDSYTMFQKKENKRMCRKCWIWIDDQAYTHHMRKHNFFGFSSIKEIKNNAYHSCFSTRKDMNTIYWSVSQKTDVIIMQEYYNNYYNYFEYDLLIGGVKSSDLFFWFNHNDLVDLKTIVSS